MSVSGGSAAGLKGSYLGFPRLCLPLELCLLRLFAAKTLKGGRDHEKQLKPLKAWKLPSRRFLRKASLRRLTVLFSSVLVCNAVVVQTKHIWDFSKVTGGRGKTKPNNTFESPHAKYPAIVGLRLARAQNGRGLWAHFLPHARTVVACLGFFFLTAKPLEPIAVAYSRRIMACRCQTMGLAGARQKQWSREGVNAARRVQLRTEAPPWASGGSALLDWREAPLHSAADSKSVARDSRPKTLVSNRSISLFLFLSFFDDLSHMVQRFFFSFATGSSQWAKPASL